MSPRREPISQISVVIHTKNAASTLERALASVVPWANDLVVADMESTDDTRKIAKSFGARVLSFDDVGYADPARNKALAEAKGPWILVLDADEEVPATLAEHLQALTEDASVQAYRVPRKNMIFGHWAKTGWWPDHIIRFFQKGAVHWPPEVHSQPIAEGVVRDIDAREEFAILHHNYDSIEQFLARMNTYTSLEAKQRGKEHVESPLRAAAHEFMRRYYQHEGYAQGDYGLLLSLLQSMYMGVAAAKRQELHGFDDANENTLLTVEHDLDEIFRDLCYWIADTHVRTERSFMKQLYWKIRRKLKV